MLMNRLLLKLYIQTNLNLIQKKKAQNQEVLLLTGLNIKIKCVCIKSVTIEMTPLAICASPTCLLFRCKVLLVILKQMESLAWLQIIMRGLISISCLIKRKLIICKLDSILKILMIQIVDLLFPLVSLIILKSKEVKMDLTIILTLVSIIGLFSWTIYNLANLISAALVAAKWP